MSNITVHGRASLSLPITLTDSTGTIVDLSELSLWFECRNANLRVELAANDADPTGRTIFLSNDQVKQLSTTAQLYCVRDETDPDRPTVMSEGTIQRTGFIV